MKRIYNPSTETVSVTYYGQVESLEPQQERFVGPDLYRHFTNIFPFVDGEEKVEEVSPFHPEPEEATYTEPQVLPAEKAVEPVEEVQEEKKVSLKSISKAVKRQVKRKVTRK